jgi:hypothetical protein
MDVDQRQIYAFYATLIVSLGHRAHLGPGEVKLQLNLVSLCHFVLEDHRIGQAMVYNCLKICSS